MKGDLYSREIKEEIVCSGWSEGFRFLVVSYGNHPCAYVEVPSESPLFRVELENLPERLLESAICHGGFTYAGSLSHVMEGESDWFLGWDYAHGGDWLCHPSDSSQESFDRFFSFAKKWSLPEIVEECLRAISQLSAWLKGEKR